MTPLVSIIIVNYNGIELLPECLKSIKEQEYSNVEIIVVDNASTDESCQYIQEFHKDVILIRSDKNIGFAGGNNLGYQYVSGQFVVLLNNDTTVTRSWLTTLVGMMEQESAGVITSKVITEEVPDEYYSKNGTVNYLGYNIMREFSDLSKIFFAGGASVIVRRKDVEQLFLNEYFLYHEDVFLSWKMHCSGKKVLMCQQSVVYHRGSATTKKQLSSFSTYYQERNRLLNTIIFYEIPTLLKLFPYIIADMVSKIILAILGMRKSVLGIMKAYGWILFNVRWIVQQRNTIQRTRIVRDEQIMGLMSHKVIDSQHPFAQILNMISKYYALLVRLNYHGRS